MQTNDFPTKYNKHIDQQVNEDINTARRQCSVRTVEIGKQRYSKPKGNGALTGASIGFGLGFFVCAGVCIAKLQDGFDYASTTGLITYVVIFLITLFLGIIIDSMAKSAYEGNESRIDERIKDENKSLEGEIETIRSTGEAKKAQYLTWFENTSQNMSVKFAESDLAKEVIDWMSDGFFRTIDSTDRRPHIERINVPFMFKVYREKITCNLGTYDFELKRCAFLKSPLEQTALARAIVTTMQLNTIMHYPQDASGTSVSIQIEYKYDDEYVCATISYLAPNGEFQNVRVW